MVGMDRWFGMGWVYIFGKSWLGCALNFLFAWSSLRRGVSDRLGGLVSLLFIGGK